MEGNMVTTGQMTGLIVAIVLPMLAGLIPYYKLWKKSSKIEGGMLGALAYGALGYFWQEIIYSFLGLVALTKMTGVLNATGGNAVFVAFVEAFAGSLFVALGLYWGIYLTNTKQRSLFRSVTIGIGFGIGSSLLTYGFQLYYAVKINAGTFTGTDLSKEAILATPVSSLYLAAYRNILVVIIYMGVALLMGKFYLDKNRLASWLVPILAYLFMRFTDVILNTYAPETVAKTVYCVVLTVLAAGALWMMRQWMKTGEVRIGTHLM